VAFAVGVDAAAELGYPQLDAVVGQRWEDELELTAGERALVLGDDKRGPTAMRIGSVEQQT
jgi:hypothetical protein